MWRRPGSVLCLSALCLGLAAMPANAGSSRFLSFAFPCDGATKVVAFSAGGFPASTNQFILGGAMNLFENHGGLQYIVLTDAASAGNKTVVAMGLNENNARFAMPTFYQVAADAAGNVPFSVIGSCLPGSGQIQGFVTLYFN